MQNIGSFIIFFSFEESCVSIIPVYFVYGNMCFIQHYKVILERNMQNIGSLFFLPVEENFVCSIILVKYFVFYCGMTVRNNRMFAFFKLCFKYILSWLNTYFLLCYVVLFCFVLFSFTGTRVVGDIVYQRSCSLFIVLFPVSICKEKLKRCNASVYLTCISPHHVIYYINAYIIFKIQTLIFRELSRTFLTL